MSIKMEGKFEAALSRIDAMILKLRQPYSQPLNVPWYLTGQPQIPIKEVTNPNLISTSLKGTPVKLKFPKFPVFKEGDPREWICEIEKYFDFYEIPGVHEISESQKLNCATLHLRGRASQWFHRHIKPRIHEISWSLFLEELIDQFDSTELEDSNKSVAVDEVKVNDVVSCGKNKDGVVVNGEDLLSFEVKVKSVEKNGDETSKVFVEMHKQEKEEKLMIEASIIFASILNHLLSVCSNVSKAFVLRLSFQRNVKRAEFESLKDVVGSDKIVLDGWPPPKCDNHSFLKDLYDILVKLSPNGSLQQDGLVSTIHWFNEAASSGGMNIDSYAWTEGGKQKTGYPTQVLALEAIYGDSILKHYNKGGLMFLVIHVHLEVPSDFSVSAKLSASIQRLEPRGQGGFARSDEFDDSLYLFKAKHLALVVLTCLLPLSYLSCSPPCFSIFVQWLDAMKVSSLCEMLDNIWNANPAQEVLYEWVEWLHSSSLPFLDFDDGVRLAPYDVLDTADMRSIFGRVSLEVIPSMVRYNDEKCHEEFINNLHQCDICDNEYAGSNFIELPCCHKFCINCMETYSDIHVKDGTVTKLVCPDLKCEGLIPPDLLRRLLGSESYDRWESLLLQKTLDSMPDVVYCPRCETVCLEDEDHHVQCVKCFFSFCTFCREGRRVGFECISQEEKLLLLQIVKELKERVATLEKKQFESDLEIQKLRNVVKDSGGEIQQLKSCVLELESLAVKNSTLNESNNHQGQIVSQLKSLILYSTYQVTTRVGGAPYKLLLLANSKIHDGFHVSQLKIFVDSFSAFSAEGYICQQKELVENASVFQRMCFATEKLQNDFSMLQILCQKLLQKFLLLNSSKKNDLRDYFDQELRHYSSYTGPPNCHVGFVRQWELLRQVVMIQDMDPSRLLDSPFMCRDGWFIEPIIEAIIPTDVQSGRIQIRCCTRLWEHIELSRRSRNAQLLYCSVLCILQTLPKGV